MFNQIISEIEEELGIKFGPILYCPRTFNPTRRLFSDGDIMYYDISEDLINSSTWVVLMESTGPYIYDICIKTLIKEVVRRTMVIGPHKKTQRLIKFNIKKHTL